MNTTTRSATRAGVGVLPLRPRHEVRIGCIGLRRQSAKCVAYDRLQNLVGLLREQVRDNGAGAYSVEGLEGIEMLLAPVVGMGLQVRNDRRNRRSHLQLDDQLQVLSCDAVVCDRS